MNGDGKSETGAATAAGKPEDEEVLSQRMVYMWGYLPGASPQRSPLLSPAVVNIPPGVESSWKDVSGGGCGFAMATSGSLSRIKFNLNQSEMDLYLITFYFVSVWFGLVWFVLTRIREADYVGLD